MRFRRVGWMYHGLSDFESSSYILSRAGDLMSEAVFERDRVLSPKYPFVYLISGYLSEMYIYFREIAVEAVVDGAALGRLQQPIGGVIAYILTSWVQLNVLSLQTGKTIWGSIARRSFPVIPKSATRRRRRPESEYKGFRKRSVPAMRSRLGLRRSGGSSIRSHSAAGHIEYIKDSEPLP